MDEGGPGARTRRGGGGWFARMGGPGVGAVSREGVNVGG